MTTKHTPGPWTVFRNSFGTCGIGHVNGDSVLHSEGQYIEVSDANARLIAASPDLLDALTALVNDFDKSVITTDPMLIKARAAIAKATH